MPYFGSDWEDSYTPSPSDLLRAENAQLRALVGKMCVAIGSLQESSTNMLTNRVEVSNEWMWKLGEALTEAQKIMGER